MDWVSQVGLVVKNPSANAGDLRGLGWIPGSGRSPGGGHGNPLQYSCPENPHGQRSLVGYSLQGHKELDAEATEYMCKVSQPFFHSLNQYWNLCWGNSLEAQWLGLHASIAGDMGSIPGQGSKIPLATHQKKKKKNFLKMWGKKNKHHYVGVGTTAMKQVSCPFGIYFLMGRW